MHISWDAARVGITGEELWRLVLETDPRIYLHGSTGGRRTPGDSSITVMPKMMMPGDEKVVADRLYEVLSKPPQISRPAEETGEPAKIAGQWNVRLEFRRGSADHALFLEQDGGNLTGTHHGDVMAGDLRGTVKGNQVNIRSSFRYEGTRLDYDFEGRVANGAIRGTVGMGEY